MRKQLGLLAGASAIAILAVANPAKAFDEVIWTWDANVNTSIDTMTTAITELTPTGLNQAENEQETIGSVSSDSGITGFSNNLDANLSGPNPTSDLAAIETGSTAMGNSASISSDVQINYDSEQVFAGLDPATPGTVSAMSSASTILNASVDSSATAVANNLTVDLDYKTSDDAIAIGNNVQSASVSASATSSVDSVTLDGFSGLGTMSNPAVSSNATAVGNNFSVDVSQAEVVIP